MSRLQVKDIDGESYSPGPYRWLGVGTHYVCLSGLGPWVFDPMFTPLMARRLAERLYDAADEVEALREKDKQ